MTHIYIVEGFLCWYFSLCRNNVDTCILYEIRSTRYIGTLVWNHLSYWVSMILDFVGYPYPRIYVPTNPKHTCSNELSTNHLPTKLRPLQQAIFWQSTNNGTQYKYQVIIYRLSTVVWKIYSLRCSVFCYDSL